MDERGDGDSSVTEGVRDSPANWISVSVFSRPEFRMFAKVVSLIAPNVKKLKEEGKISTWHFRCNGTFNVIEQTTSVNMVLSSTSFRLKPIVSQMDFVKSSFKKQLDELGRQGHVVGFSYEDEKFKFDDKSIKETYGSWQNWQLLIEIDELLSEIIGKILSQRHKEWQEYFFHEIAVHLLFNMFGKQELFKSYQFKQGRHTDMIRLLTDESGKMLQGMFDRKRYEGRLREVPLRAVFFFEV